MVLASASKSDGAIMTVRWCNNAFTKITGYTFDDVVNQRGAILIGPSMPQGQHLSIMEKLMDWEQFSINVLNNRKSGEKFRHRMSWVPLSDAETGNRWWLCSLIELPQLIDTVVQDHSDKTPLGDNASVAWLQRENQVLRDENTRLQALATSVMKDSHEDPLTGLHNRRYFEVELRSRFAKLSHGDAGFAVLYIDLDRFKAVNDTFGHFGGDRLLINVSETLCSLVDKDDLVARIGGDEFVILKQLGQSALNISQLADAIVTKMLAPFTFEGRSAATSASVGVAIADAGTVRPEDVIADADAALYHAKSCGRGRWSFFTKQMHADLTETRKLASDILTACERHEFEAYFQPVIDSKTGRIVSAEALVRWAHPTRGILAPAAFLDAAASVGVLHKIDALMLGEVAESLRYFDAAGIGSVRVAINTSADRLNDPSLVHDIKSSGIEPRKLVLEILESVSLDQVSEAVRRNLDELSDMGVDVAIDDFGTGHASILGLLQIKPSVVKVDRQFVTPIVADPVSRRLVSSMVAMGKGLGMKVVAEGVETEQHARMASQMGFDFLQGYYFGKPMSVANLCRVVTEKEGQFLPRNTMEAPGALAAR